MVLTMSRPAARTASAAPMRRSTNRNGRAPANVARRIVADLVAIAAAIGLDRIQPLLLGLEGDRDAVAVGTGAREPVAVRNPDHRRPVDRRIILRGGGETWRHHGGQVEKSCRARSRLWGNRPGRSRAPIFGRSPWEGRAARSGRAHRSPPSWQSGFRDRRSRQSPTRRLPVRTGWSRRRRSPDRRSRPPRRRLAGAAGPAGGWAGRLPARRCRSPPPARDACG